MATRSLGSLTLDLIARTLGFEQGMDRAARVADSRMKQIEASAKKLGTALGLAITAATGTIGVALKGAIDGMDELSKAAQRAGVSTETFSELAYAAKLADVSVQDLQSAFGRLAKAQADALDESTQQAKVFRALGIQIADATGKLRNADEVFLDFADAFRRNQGSPEILAAGMQIFGRSFQNLIPLIKDGSEGLRGAADEARQLGQVISTEAGKQAEEFNDNLTRLAAFSKGLANTFARELLPQLVDLSGEMVANNKASRDAADGVREFASSIADLMSFGRDALSFLERFRSVLVGVEKQGNAAFQSLNPANWSRSGIGRLTNQYNQGSDLINQSVSGSSDSGPGVIFIDPADALERDRKALAEAKRSAQELEALRKLAFGGRESSRGSKRSGKSDAEREAEQLQKSYESLMESMRERIALFGKEGEAAKVRYQVEQGSLQALGEELKLAAISRAEQLDQMQRVADLQKAADDAVREHTRSVEEGRKRTQELIEDMKFEYGLMRMSNIEREKAIATRYADAHATAEQIKQIQDLAAQNYELAESIRFQDGMRREFEDFFSSVLKGTTSIKDAFENMLEGIGNMIANRIAQNWVDQLFGNMGQSGGGQFGGWLSQLAGLFGGGRANGGWTNANSIYEVNERGIEMATVRGRDYLLTGNAPVEITPNERLGVGGNRTTVVNMTLQGRVDRRTESQIAREVSIQQRIAARNN